MTRKVEFGLAVLIIGGFVSLQLGCGSDQASGSWSVSQGNGGATQYGSNTTVVTSPGQTDTSVIVTGDPTKCVNVDQSCVDVATAKQKGGKYCDDPNAQADVIVIDGEVAQVICYPPKDNGTDIRQTAKDADGNTQVPQTDSGTVVTFDPATDGQPIDGDVKLDAERTTLYGNGPDKTIINGNLTVESNNARVRGMTITGNVEFHDNSNDSAISFCRIQGNLHAKSNGFTATNCQVFGNVKVEGNNATLVNIGVAGTWEVNSNATCAGCYSFDDGNQDNLVQSDEIGDPIDCSQR